MKRIGLAFLILFALLVLDSQAKGLTPRDDIDRLKSESVLNSVVPQQRVQRRCNINFSITNWGFLGSQTRELYESPGCLFCDHPDKEVAAPSFEFPSNSGLEYLFQGILWIGGVVDGETLVTVAVDPYGWSWDFEFWPSSNIKEREWLGDQECITSFADTFIRPQGDIWEPDPDMRPHKPLNVEIIQHSYSWQSPPFDDFIILDYSFRNIGQKPISDIYLGFYMDADIYHFSESPYHPEEGAQDDLTGFLRNYVDSSGETTKVNIAWAADNNGQPYSGEFTEKSPNGIIGIKLLDCSNSNPEISYNWWNSHDAGYPYDWGPWLKANQEKWEQINPYGSGIYFPDNAMGTPGGDISKYFLMSNGEVDYDQIFTAVFSKNDTSWIPADPKLSYDFVQGCDTRFTYSFGPFDLAPGDSIFAVIALVAGDSFHTDYSNRARYLPNNPNKYYENLDFTDLVNNVQKAQEVYESGYTLPPPGPPQDFRALNISSSAVKLSWSPKPHPNLKGYNVYRCLESEYSSPKKLNRGLITNKFYIDEDLIEGEYYNYWIASVNQNDQEGKRSLIKVLAGRPRVPSGLKAESSKDQVCLSWYPGGERDLVGYKIYRTDYDTTRMIDSVGLITEYRDYSVINGLIYYYKISAVDSLGLESFFSDSAYALPMAFDRGVGVFDRTVTYWYMRNWNTENLAYSVDSLYQKAFQQMGIPWEYLVHDYWGHENWPISLQDLSPYPVVVIHSEDLAENSDYSIYSTAAIIRHYLRAGGKMIFEGTNNSDFFFSYYFNEMELNFCDSTYLERVDSLFCQLLFLDQAYIPFWKLSRRTEEFIGAYSTVTEYPDLQIDPEKVDSGIYIPSGYELGPLEGKLPGVGYIIPKDTSIYPVEVIYTFHSVYDTSDLEGKPVAIRYLGDDYQFVFFNFPFYYIQEEQAIQVLQQALRDLGVPTGVEEEPEEEISAGGFSLKQNYPNPFNLTTTIPFTIPSLPVNSSQFMVHSPPTVTLNIYNILGQKVRTLVDEKKLPGEYKVNWDGKDEKGNEVGSGIYLYKLKARDYQQVKKMVLLK